MSTEERVVATNRFRSAWRQFDYFRTHVSELAQMEYELAMDELLNTYNTTIRENRFTVGGATEVLTAALLSSADLEVRLAGEGAFGVDLFIGQEVGFSLKGSFTPKHSNIGLLNKQGGGKREWKEATIIIRSKVGLVFVAPDMVDPSLVIDKPDQVTLHKKAVTAVIDDGRFTWKANVPTKLDTPAHKAEAVSKAIASEILRRQKADTLFVQLGRIGAGTHSTKG